MSQASFNSPERKILTPIWAAALLTTALSCAHKTLPAPPSTPAVDNSYLDVVPGGSLQIVVPLLKSGAPPLAPQSLHQDGNTFLVSAANLVGYDVSYYSIERASHDKVRLRFTIAQLTEGDRRSWDYRAPALPFALPRTPQYIRLIYLVRKSQSDHNMAIVASNNRDALNAATKQLENHPDVCGNDGEIFCSWVPSGIAVRPESQPPPKP